jgi:hypothetical protein
MMGLVEANGLAVIGVLLWRAQPLRSWHLTGAAVHVLLGASNLVFWQIFVAANSSVGCGSSPGASRRRHQSPLSPDPPILEGRIGRTSAD